MCSITVAHTLLAASPIFILLFLANKVLIVFQSGKKTWSKIKLISQAPLHLEITRVTSLWPIRYKQMSIYLARLLRKQLFS